VLDQAAPVYAPHPIGPAAPIASWAAIPRVVIERVPTFAYTWDDDDPTVDWDASGKVWDDPAAGGGYVDAVCDFQAVELAAGNPDELMLFPAARAVVSLDNRTGRWTQYDESGRLIYFAPGRRLHVLADYAGEAWWLFSGTIDTWDLQADGSVAVEAHDRLAVLAAEIGTYTPGSGGTAAAQRLSDILTVAGDTGPTRFDPGGPALTAQPTERSPLEECQVVALSAGGILYADADGTLLYRDQLWTRGRDDQPTVPVFSDNVCTGDAVVVWDAELSTDDEHLATKVTLTNVAGTTVTATTNDPLLLQGQPYPLTHPDPDQWTTAAQGQAVANATLNLYDKLTVGVRRFELHLLDPTRSLWRTGIDMRLGDRIRFQHDFPVPSGVDVGTFDITAIVSTITHEITPEAWVVGVGTTPAVAATITQRWDRTQWMWDQADAVWR